MKRILGALALLVSLVSLCPAQLTIQVQNAGTPLTTAKKWLAVNCSTGMTCTFTNGVIVMTASGGGSGTVTAVSGTTNQVAVATGTTTPVLSIPATFIAPGTISAVTSIDATKLVGNLPAIDGSLLTGLQVIPNTSTNILYTVPTGLPANTTSQFGGSNVSNQTRVVSWFAPFTKTSTKFCYEVGTTADNTANNYDVGIFTGVAGGTGTLLANAGPTAGTTFAPTTSSFHCLNWAQGTVTIPAGRVYLAFTTNASAPATIFAASLVVAANASNVAITAAGTLNTGITLPADSNSGYGIGTNVPELAIQ